MNTENLREARDIDDAPELCQAAKPLATAAQNQAVHLFNSLRPRTRQVAKLLVTTSTTDQAIATVMGTHTSVVHRAITELLDATGMDNRVELALYIVRRPELERLLIGVQITPPQKRRAGQ